MIIKAEQSRLEKEIEKEAEKKTKRKCGMGMIVTRLKETTCHSMAMSVLLLNIRKIERLRETLLLLFVRSFKLVFIQ